MFRNTWIAAALVLIFGTIGRSDVVVMDQIGPNGTFTAGQTPVNSQIFEPGLASFSEAAVDNFSLATASTLDSFQAAMRVFAGHGFGSFAGVTDWEIAIYSTKAAAVANLTGDIADVHIVPGSVTVTGGFNTDATSALVTVPLSISLNAGNYFIAVLPHLNLGTFGQLGVYISTFSGTPGDSNAFLANPGGGGGFPGNVLDLQSNIAYRLTAAAVPEPSSVILISVGVGLFALRRLGRAGGTQNRL
jgi:hypothetical protein